MRSEANGHVKWRRSPVESSIQVYGDRDLLSQKLSPNQPVYNRHGAREKSGILNINTPIF